MLKRAVALFIAWMVLGWAVTLPAAAASAPTAAAAQAPLPLNAPADAAWPEAGTVADPASETPALLPAALQARNPGLVLARPARFDPTAPHAPFLAGPLRPPCAAGRQA